MKNILSHFNLGTISKRSRFDSLSIVSRQSVFAIILVFLTAFGGNAWGETIPANTIIYVDIANFHSDKSGYATDGKYYMSVTSSGNVDKQINKSDVTGAAWKTYDLSSDGDTEWQELKPISGNLYAGKVMSESTTGSVSFWRRNAYNWESLWDIDASAPNMWDSSNRKFTISSGYTHHNDRHVAGFSTTTSAIGFYTPGATLYLKVNSNWKEGSARFSACFGGYNIQTWVDCSQVGSSDYYSVTVPEGEWPMVIFCRMNPDEEGNGWDEEGHDRVWNQTDDLLYEYDHNLCTITGWSNSQTRGQYAPNGALHGSLNSWVMMNYKPFDGNGELKLELGANTAYEFQIISDELWYGYGDEHYKHTLVGQTEETTLSSGGKDILILTADAGEYTFNWDKSTHELSVTYPNLPNSTNLNPNYVYVTNTSGWSPVNAHVFGSEFNTTVWGYDPALSSISFNNETYYYAATGYETKIQFGQGLDADHKTADLTVSDGKGKYYNPSTTSWNPFSSTITLNNQSATTVGTESVDADLFSTTLSKITCPEKNGCTFGGYFTATGGGGVQLIEDDGDWIASVSGYTNSSTQWIRANTELYAKWTANNYSVTLNTNSGTINEGNVTSYTYGTGATLPTNVTKLGYKFDGWYDNSELTGSPVTTISTSDYGDKEYWAKWTSIAESMAIGEHPEFLALQEGDLIVVTVTNIQPGAQISLRDWSSEAIETRNIGNEDPGQFAFRLSADAASAIRTNGLRITGVNYTKSSVDVLYRKTIWSGSVTSDDAWETTGGEFANSLFADLEAGNYMGVHVSATGTGCVDAEKGDVNWHNYTVQAEYRSAIVFGDATVGKDSIYLHELNADQVDSLQHKNHLLIGFACLTLSDLYTYISTRAYRVDVASVSNVTISATTPSVSEGSYGNANYGSTVSLSYSVDAGYAWGGWNVYKTGDPSTTVTVTNNQFTMPPYPVTVSAVLYTNLAAWCVPNTVTFSGDDHLTSRKDVFVQTTVKASNLFNISCSDLGSATSMEIAYLDADDDDAEVAKGDSKFRLYGGASDSTIVKDASAIDISASRELDTNYGLRYTPDAYNVTNHYKVQLTFKKGDLELKTVTKDVYGRGLPETFVIAVKNTSDSKWYALPDTLASSSGKHLQPIAIVVDNTTTPTTALYAPSVTAYQSMGRNNANKNMHGVRLSSDGTTHVRVSTSIASGEANSTLWSQTGNMDDLEAFYLKSSDFNSYQISLEAITTKKLGLYSHSAKTYMGYSANASPYAIYLLPIASFGLTISYNTSDTRVIEFHVANGNEQIWESDVIDDLTAAQIAGTFVVGTKNAAGDYVTCTHSAEESAATINGRKISGTADLTAGATGRFQIFVNTSTSNFGLRWVPTENHTLISGYWGGKYASPGKWSLGREPTIDEDVYIKHQTSIVQQVNAQAKSIKIDKSAEENPIWDLTIDDWKGALLVKEDIKAKHYGEDEYGPTTKNDLSIRTSILGNGGLICGNASSNTAAEYEFYSKVYRFGSYYINQYVGIPFVSMNPYQWYGINVFEYNPDRDDWMTPENSDLKPFTCYNIISKTSGISYTEFYTNGTLNLPGLDSITTLECGWRDSDTTSIAGKESGYQDYMFANSWTAPISVEDLDEDDCHNLVQTIYIFNAGYVPKEGDEKILGEESGTWSSIPFKSARYMTNAVIPATQAFLVTATASGAYLNLNYKKHVYDPAINADSINTAPTRAPRRQPKEAAPEKLKIKVHNDTTIADKLYFFQRADFETLGFDNGWDGYKLLGEDYAAEIYSIRGNNKLAVDAVPELDETEIGFKAGTQANEYTFSFEYDEQEEPLYLYDKDTQEFTEITNESTYSFVTSDRKEHARFILTRSNVPQSPTGVEEVENETVQRAEKFMKDQQIFIRRGERTYSITGARVR